MSERFRRASLGTVLTIFIVVIIGSFGLVRPAKAFPVTVIDDFQAQIQQIYANIKDNIKTAIIQAAINAISSAMKKMAYDSAVWLASGGKGQTPFAHTNGFGDYMKQVGDSAGGVFIEELGNGIHLNLCNIPDVRADLALRIGLKQRYNPDTAQKAECKFSEFIENWSSGDNWASQYGSEEALLKRFNASINMDDSDFGIYLKSSVQLDQTIARQQDAAKSDRLEGGGWKSLTKLISGDILTPSDQMRESANAYLPSEISKKSEQLIGSALGSDSAQAITGAMSVFLNTLSSQMINNFQTKGILPFGICTGGLGGEVCKENAEIYEGQPISGRKVAEALFADYLNVKVHSVSDYPILEELVACDDVYNASPNNCTIDHSFVKAVEEARYSDPLTIRQAVKTENLNGSWKLISPKNKALDNDKNCRNSAFCYSNIKKLRLAGILPLGFEIAALNADPDAPASLSQYLDGFDDCNYVDPNNKALGIVSDQSDKPFCHLIDPNWILKVDSARCNAKVFGNEVAPKGDGSRMEECVDMSTCVGYNPDGSCYSYGYCLRSQNYWDFDLDKCDRQYATCNVYTDNTGNSLSYLSRTLQTEDCTKENAGCTAYSLVNYNGGWADPINPRGLHPSITLRDVLEPYQSVAVHFNSSIDTSCTVQSAGCSAFKVANSSEMVLSLKKAPNYLHCYDTLTGGQGNQWPRTYADLQKVKVNASTECSNYAGVCIEEEVGCALYKPLSYLGRDIPGKFKPAEVVAGQLQWNDQCDQSCVGYDAYKEMPSTYSSGHDPVYIIPSSNAACRIEDDGCSSFTNLSTAVGQQENVEYYSYLRSCLKPGAGVNQKNFYTYEGSIVGGYQLQTFTLQAATTGAPNYSYRTPQELSDYNTQCNPTLYQSGQAGPDCRQFNDEAGNIYYALLSKTIVVSEQCTPYRLNSSDFPAGQCYQNGEYRDGFCYYYGLPAGVASKAGSSRTCSASVESCRPYKGNAANRTQKIFEDTFESSPPDVALAGWDKTAGTISQSPESTHRGEHSLGYSGASNFYKTVPVHPGRSYVLSFWAKGNATSLDITFQSSMGTFGSAGIGGVWQNFRFGPVEYTGTSSSTLLRFAVSSNSQVFLDNVQLVEVTDYLYLVKNKLTIPDVCDSNKLDDQPGEALGCSAYRSTGGETRDFYLTGFSYLCRDEALGCTALLDTYNTVEDPGPSAYNVWLSGTGGSLVKRTVQGKEYSCQIPVGKNGCYVNIQGATAAQILSGAGAGSFVTSTQYIPADTPTSTPIYLVANREGSCNAIDLGCTIAGKQEFGPSGARYVTTTVKNLPANYATSLCTNEAVGCSAYGFNQGATYFKDPKIFGNKICEYKTGVAVGGVKSNGWFWKNAGTCSNAGSNYCERNEDCGVGNTCENIGNQPCYPDYTQNGEYSLWSSGNKDKYKNFVGECPSSQTSCTEFVDHNKGANVSYYFLNNSKLRTKQDACQGQVSEKLGCILLDQTDQPSKYWSTAATYLLSEKNGFAAVAPDPNLPGTKDANLIIKVTQDRQCSEWLACNSSQTVFDPETNAYKEVCIDLGVCNKAQLSDTVIGQCASWVDTSVTDSSGQVLKNKMLTNNSTGYNYLRRDVSFYGKDFTGYSLFNSYQIDDLRFNANGLGFNLSGSTFVSPNGSPTTIPRTCRGYPDAFAPFPFGTNLTTAVAPKLCVEGKNCECSYTKVVYEEAAETVEQYYPLGQLVGGEGICFGGYDVENNLKSGKPCISNQDCLDDRQNAAQDSALLDGKCVFSNKEKTKKYIGWEGVCLEKNPDTGFCELWYPVDTPNNAKNRYNLFTTAGYLPPSNAGKFWCADAKGNASRNEDSKAYRFVTREKDSEVIPKTKFWSDERLTLPNADERSIHYSEIVAISMDPTGYYAGKDWPTAEMLLFLNQEVAGRTAGKGRYSSGPLKITENNELFLDIFWSGDEGISLTYDTATKAMCDMVDRTGLKNQNFFATRFIFDYNTGYLKLIKSKICDGSSSSGGIKTKLSFYLTEVCANIRQTVDDSSTEARGEPFGFKAKGRTDRLWSGGSYAIATTSFRITYDQLFTPFGSFNRTAQPVTVALGNYLNSRDDLYGKRQSLTNAGYWPIWLAPRGATPLACLNNPEGGNCGNVSLCQGGLNNGKECVPEEDSEYSDDCKEPFQSECLGRDESICQNGPKAGISCTDDSDCRPEVQYKVCRSFPACTAKSGDDYTRFNVPCANEDRAITGGLEGLLGLLNHPSIVQCARTTNVQGFITNHGGSSSVSCGYSDTGTGGQKTTSKYCGWQVVGGGFEPYYNGANEALACSDAGGCGPVPDQPPNIYSCAPREVKRCEGGPLHGGGPLPDGTCQSDSECQDLYEEAPSLLCPPGQGESNRNVTRNGQVVNLKYCHEYVPHKCIADVRNVGYCVGGKNHGLACASAADCPETTYTSDKGREVVERGTCVGLALDPNMRIPTEPFLQTDPLAANGEGLDRLLELFVEWYGTWGWSKEESKYVLKNEGRGMSYSGDLSGTSVTRQIPGASTQIHIPLIFSLKTDPTTKAIIGYGRTDSFSLNGKSAGNLQINGGGAVVMQFYAFADNNQMPLTRVKVQWGDGSPDYSTNGWFKNHKPVCGNSASNSHKYCQYESSGGWRTDYNQPCKTEETCNNDINPGSDLRCQALADSRLMFGNSPGACQEGYFEFTHYYECRKDGPGWVESRQQCEFVPKVQVMDNWDWCSGFCDGGRGCYDGEISYCSNDDFDDLAWISFRGEVRVKP